ncbi:hypothetical protein LGK95_21465 [Clostridium algoriphilum]|uniref:hypothetical protein n=1 Tax=Clostridium algoriphilum TaxID=198347 RepID=UPI001CF1C687|nr:hypothetical protein [Clostridium algoriphilum]MCB2296023.1 hypothetical protein [Clostridium algoriphilum]
MCNYHCKDCENLGQCMSMMNILMYDEEDEKDEEDKDLKYMYRKSYTVIYPMVKHHCDMKRFIFTWKSGKNVPS